MTKEALSRWTSDEIDEILPSLVGWALVDDKLYKEFIFDDFAQAFGFMASVAVVAERRGHHPEWSNVYNKVCVSLVTHDSRGITRLDSELALILNQLAARP